MTDITGLKRRLAVARSNKERQAIPFLNCPYCKQWFGPWGSQMIEPCRLCRQPLHRSFSWRRQPRVVMLQNTMDGIQGVCVLFAIGLFIEDQINMRQLCNCVALALFVSGSIYIASGSLAWRSQIARTCGQIVVGREAQIAGVATITFGVLAMLLSVMSLTYLIGEPR